MHVDNERKELVARLAPLGVSEGYINASGVWVETPTEALKLASGNFADHQPVGFGEPLVCSPDRWHPELFGTLILENGFHFQVQGIVGEPGYHILYTEDGQLAVSNLKEEGGQLSLPEGRHSLLFYNNDTEYIVFEHTDRAADATASTRPRSRSDFQAPQGHEDEPTIGTPDMIWSKAS